MKTFACTFRVPSLFAFVVATALVAGCNSTSLRPSAVTTSSSLITTGEFGSAPSVSTAPSVNTAPLFSDGNADISVSVFEVSRKNDHPYVLPEGGYLQFRASVFNNSPGVIEITGFKARFENAMFADAVISTAKLMHKPVNLFAEAAEVGIGFIPGVGAIAGMFVAQQYETAGVRSSIRNAQTLGEEMLKTQSIAPKSPSTGSYVFFPESGKVVGLTVFYKENNQPKSYELPLLQSTIADTASVVTPDK